MLDPLYKTVQDCLPLEASQPEGVVMEDDNNQESGPMLLLEGPSCSSSPPVSALAPTATQAGGMEQSPHYQSITSGPRGESMTMAMTPDAISVSIRRAGTESLHQATTTTQPIDELGESGDDDDDESLAIQKAPSGDIIALSSSSPSVAAEEEEDSVLQLGHGHDYASFVNHIEAKLSPRRRPYGYHSLSRDHIATNHNIWPIKVKNAIDHQY